MSLRGFHIVFVIVCTLLFGFLTMWSFLWAPEHSPLARAFGAIGICGLVLLPFYGLYFYRKAKNFS